MLADTGRVPESLAFSASVRVCNVRRMSSAASSRCARRCGGASTIFGHTGGIHAAAIFDADMKRVAAAECLGRYDAMDKAIGYTFLCGANFVGCGVFTSSCISYETAAMVVRAGLN